MTTREALLPVTGQLLQNKACPNMKRKVKRVKPFDAVLWYGRQNTLLNAALLYVRGDIFIDLFQHV